MQHSYAVLADHIRRHPHPRVPRGRPPALRARTGRRASVSVSTATRCYRLLEHEGYAQARYKSGMYVADWKALRQARAAPRRAARAGRRRVRHAGLAAAPNDPALRADGQPLPLALHLASAAPEWYPCETLARIAQRLLRENPRLLGAYPSGTGLPAFKHEVLRHLAACGIDADPRDLLITNGATEAMQIALRAWPGPAIPSSSNRPCTSACSRPSNTACARWKFLRTRPGHEPGSAGICTGASRRRAPWWPCRRSRIRWCCMSEAASAAC